MDSDATALIPVPKRKPGPRNALDVPKIKRISPMIRAAIALLVSGGARTQKEAAELVGCRADYLCKQLAKQHVEEYMAREEKREVCGSITGAKAAHVYTSLLDDDSGKIRLEAADRILTARGTLPNAKGGGTRVGVNVAVTAGYVIKLRGHGEADEAPTINATASIIHES